MDQSSASKSHHKPHHGEEEDDYKAASKATVDYDKYMPRLKPEHKALMRLVRWIFIILVIIGLGAMAYKAGPSIGRLYTEKSKPKVVVVTSGLTSKVSSPTSKYQSSNQNLSFNYPPKWKVVETTNKITVTSPAMILTDVNDKHSTGRIILSIRDQNISLNEFSAGNPMAIKASQVISYTNPAPGQRGSTYMSFLNYANSKGKGVSGVYITGNTGYQVGQYAMSVDLKAVDPIVAITFVVCTNSQCTGSTSPLTIATSSWDNASFSEPLQAMLSSLVIN